MSEKDVRVATARREQAGPTLDQVKHVIAMMPADSAIERRDRALIAFTLLTGARDNATASMRMKHVNLAAGGSAASPRSEYVCLTRLLSHHLLTRNVRRRRAPTTEPRTSDVVLLTNGDRSFQR